MKLFSETRGPVLELTRHFAGRMFESELFSAAGSWRSAAIGAFSMLLVTGVAAFYTGKLPVGRANASIASESGRMLLFMAISGLLAVFQWQALLPSRSDYLALAGLPVRPRKVFTARFLAFGLFAATAVATLTFLPSLLAPPIAPEHSLLTNAAARGVTSSMACFFALFAMVTVQGALLNLLPGRVYARCSGYVQGISAAIFFLCALESWHVAEWADAGTFLESFAWAPPVWFVCLQTDLLGRGNDSMQALGERAVWASAAALVSAVAIYFVSYCRYRNLLLESSAPARTGATRGFNWIELLVRDPRRAAVLEFMDKTLSRSRAHRLTLLGYGGLAFGLLINSVLLAFAAAHWRVDWDTLLRFMVLYWPLAASMILIPGLRHALSVPAELNANWIFRIHESLGRAQWMSAVETFVLAYAVLPVFVLLTPAAIMVLGWAVGLRMVALESLAALSIFEFLFYSWQKLPFTCAYTPGKKPLASTVGRYLAAIYFLAPALSVIIATASQLFAIFVVFACGFAALWLWARRQRLQGWGESRLLYEDDDETPIGLGVKT